MKDGEHVRLDKLPLIVSVGDPAGVGPEVSVAAAREFAPETPVVLVGDAEALRKRCAAEGVATEDWAPGKALAAVGLWHEVTWTEACVAARGPTAEGGVAQRRILECAANLVAQGHGRALVTGPTSKKAVELSGHPFTGQTEHLAALLGQARDSVTMCFLGPRLKVALVTTHHSVRDAAAAVTAARVQRSVHHLAAILQRLGGGTKILVTGVNPHAGEGGLFGTEEQAMVTPALRAFDDDGWDVTGPVPAEAALRFAAEGRCDGVVAMLHDQATIASKLLDWGQAVNVTWGLPIVRTSVDHGTAYDVAGTGKADASGMVAAMRMALSLT